MYWMHQCLVDVNGERLLVYDNVGYVRIVSCELVNRLIEVCRTQYSCLDPIPICMSGGVHVAMYYNR